MDKGHSDVIPNKPSPIPRRADKHIKPKVASRNVLSYLLSRQLGMQRNDVDLSEWLWMLT